MYQWHRLLRLSLGQPYYVRSQSCRAMSEATGRDPEPAKGKVELTPVTNDPAIPPPEIVGQHYVVDRELGRGGMATVYLCRDSRDQSRVAVKILRQELGSAVVIERFLREISFASELDHPRIPKVLDSGVIDGLPYYVMTYIEGESLKSLIQREKQLPIPDATRIACDVIATTAYAHEHGIVHRDLKPDNILISESGVYILDFGIARAIVESGVDRLTSTGIGVGTPAYMSPEQALGDRNLDARSDIYSLGCVLYEMIAGMPPFVGPTAQVIISRRFAATPPALGEMRDAVPEELEAVITRALARAPADRWPTAKAFGEALRSCETATGRPREPTFALRRAALARIALGLLVVVLVTSGIIAWSRANRTGFEKAHDALGTWDLASADANLTNAVGARPTDASAQLWLAQIRMLRGEPLIRSRPLILFATDHRAELQPIEQLRADALASQLSGNFAAACKQWEDLTTAAGRRSTGDFTPALAFADCVRADDGILEDKTSASGHRFRSSYQLADSIYEALLSRHSENPAAYAVVMPRLEEVLPIEKSAFRKGISRAAVSETFMALPTLRDDTLAYTPYPIAGSGAPWRTRDVLAIDAALLRNRQRLRTLAIAWTEAASRDVRAHELLARVLEVTGELSGSNPSALEEVRNARRVGSAAAGSEHERFLHQLRLGIQQVRLYLRLSRFAEAGALSDSLAVQPMPSRLDDDSRDEATEMLTTLAALRGRPLRVIALNGAVGSQFPVFLPTGTVAMLPPSVVPDAIALYAYAESGGPQDSILVLATRVSEKIAAVVPAAQVEPLRIATMRRPLTLAASVVGPKPASRLGATMDPYILALKAFADRDTRRTRIFLDSLTDLHADYAPGEITMDVVYCEAWLRAQIGDPLGASRELDKALAGLPVALPTFLGSSTSAASLVRVMALRAELASQLQQAASAKSWATAVIQLWERGDFITAPTIERMRKLR